MYLKRFFCVVLVCMLSVGLVGMPAGATEMEYATKENDMLNFMVSRATGSFNMAIPAKTKLSASTSFPLAAGETVTIKASYSPFSASVDFGLIAPNGMYYYFNVTNGSIDKTIQVPENGEYTLQIRNNADVEVEVAGFVNY